MDELSDDEDLIFDDNDFQDEYPFDVDEIQQAAAAVAASGNSNNDQQRSSLDNSENLTFNAETSKLIEEFDLEKFSKELLSKAGTGDLATCLYNHWSKFVPLCYSATENPKNNIIETDSTRILFKPFEIFICNDQNSDKVTQELKQLDDPSLLCGHVFKAGEPSYVCRDCGTDSTCVLCSGCFLNSKHRYHKYKILRSSGGGGYCDCGDIEAWKQDPSCEIHTRKNSSELQTADDMIQKLPNDLVQRARQLFEFLLEYAYDMLCGEHKELLPPHLRPEKSTDDYIIMLFNDELHSYDTVIRTLKKVLRIDDLKAFEYATIVDNEGRSALKRANKKQCEEIKTGVEDEMRGSTIPPLETRVIHNSLVAHQYFAEKIIAWLQKFTEFSKALKHVLCRAGFTVKTDNYSFIEKLMLSDAVLWKSARSTVHQFYIAIYFMDTNWKKEFAILYTKNYQLIWRNHVKNSDEKASLTDLAVQLFTVISLHYTKIIENYVKDYRDIERRESITKAALQFFTNDCLSKYLISNFNLLQIIMDTLIEQSKARIDDKGRLNFSRVRTKFQKAEYKRAQDILFDLKYCLISVPDSWNDQIREGYLNGYRSFVQFLKVMNGMDAVKRYIDQHIEFEPEWDTAFNLSIKLECPLGSFIEWSSSDKYVLYQSYNYLLEILNELSETDTYYQSKFKTKKYLNKEYELIDYDITKQEVSIHAQLTRLLAPLHAKLPLHQIKFNEFPLISSKKLKIESIIEPSLRALAMVAQSNVGLWRRNGYSLINQVFFYSNVKCRVEMYDRDILCLQMGASIMDANEYLVSLMNRFRLLDYWTKDNPEGKSEETKLEYLNSLAEEFLQLLIVIVGERYESGVGEVLNEDKLKREVIHQLCISPMAHSDIVKNVFDRREVNVNELESVLKQVATFKSSTTPTAKGIYELKNECLDSYNPYFYHYSKIEKTKSEDYVLKNKPATKKFLPPPIPPLFTDSYVKIRNILQSDVFIHIILTVLKRYTHKAEKANKSDPISDGQLVRVLHLIGMALNEEKQQNLYSNVDSFKFIEKTSKKKSDSIIVHMNAITSLSHTIESYKLLASWIRDYIESLSVKASSISSSPLKSSENATGAEASAIDMTLKSNDETKKAEQVKDKRKTQIKAKAEQRRLKMLSKMSAMQKDFIQKNKDFFDMTPSEAEMAQCSSTVEMELGFEQQNVICLGPNQTQVTTFNPSKRYRCILCQEDQELSLNGQPMVLCCYVQNSKVLSKDFSKNIENIDKFDPLFMPNNTFWGIHTTSCGHVMHSNCWEKYVEGIKLSESRRHGRYINFTIKRNEFLCPLCETIGNTVLPLLPNFRDLTNQSAKVIDITYDDWLDGLKKTLDNSIHKELNDDEDKIIIEQFPLSNITKFMAEAVARNFNLLFSYSGVAESTHIPTELKISVETLNVIEIFSRFAFVFGFIAHPNDDDPRMPITTWNNCAYTVQAMEQLLRTENKPIFGQLSSRQCDLLSNLVKFASLYAISKNQTHVREYCLKILAAILPYNSVFFDKINVMNCDLFHLLVYLCFSMPFLYENPTITSSIPCGNINEAYIFRIMFQAHCVQILINKSKLNTFNKTVDEYEDEFVNVFLHHEATSDSDEITDQEMKIYELFEYILAKTNLNVEKPHPKIVTKALKIALMPFMRCSVIFFNYLTDITPPISDTEQKETFNYICNYLGISKDINVLLDLNNPFFKDSVDKWCSVYSNSKPNNIDYPIKVNQLMNLPNDFIDLISTFPKIPSNLTGPDSISTLCLTCGETLTYKLHNSSEEIGSTRVGPCTAHAFKCGKTNGLFLNIADCQVILLHLNVNAENELVVRGSYIPAPYLDDYGETDQGLTRGNPLHLCMTRYKKLHKLWISHSIPDEVSRSYQILNNQPLAQNETWILL